MGRTLRQTIAEGRRTWIDFYRFAESLFGMKVPWLDEIAFSSFHARVQGLLRSDVITLPVADVANALLASDKALSAAMASKTRCVYPLRRLLEEDRLRRVVANLLGVLRDAHPQAPLVLGIPSPRLWLASAYESVKGGPPPASAASDMDAAESAAVYIADFLRNFQASGVDALLVVEAPGEAPVDAEQLSAYQAIIRCVRHCQWEVGLLDAAALSTPAIGRGLDFCVVSDDSGHDGVLGSPLSAEFFSCPAASREDMRRCLYLDIPPGGALEPVVQCLAELRMSVLQEVQR